TPSLIRNRVTRKLMVSRIAVIKKTIRSGVEFDHTQIIHYQPQEAKALSAWIESTPMVYEAHSTDYQTRQAYRALRDPRSPREWSSRRWNSCACF
ncbi:hypothetical protein FK521_28860, partial [Klebsiella pneumoniae]